MATGPRSSHTQNKSTSLVSHDAGPVHGPKSTKEVCIAASTGTSLGLMHANKEDHAKKLHVPSAAHSHVIRPSKPPDDSLASKETRPTTSSCTNTDGVAATSFNVVPMESDEGVSNSTSQ